MDASTNTQFRPADAAAIADAAIVLRRGDLVAFPTETVYGLGADATNGNAVASVFAAKGRPQFNPLIIHVKDMAQAETLVHFSPAAMKLAKLFWPGALTLVLPRRAGSPVSLLASAGLETIALRMPAHPVAQQLLEAAGVPIAAPSANLSGRISATAASHVADELSGKVTLVLDGGPTPLGIESTVVGFDGDIPVLLRPGAIARDAIEAVVGALHKPGGGKIASPGQLESHYAPRARLRLDAKNVEPGEALLAFGPKVPSGALQVLNLSAGGDLREAAANLFAMLRTLDSSGAGAIAVMPIPHAGLGEAINDRLRRAAAPRGDQR
jgi:L-threonylcarbamoyladenylate synthase